MTHDLKKIILLATTILMVSVVSAYSENPIPSFNFHLKKQAIFTENGSSVKTFGFRPEKRDMNVSNDTPGYRLDGFDPDRPCGFGSGRIEVVIYRLDHTKFLGPFVVYAGRTLTVPIDGYQWGVFARTNHNTVISVWSSHNH